MRDRLTVTNYALKMKDLKERIDYFRSQATDLQKEYDEIRFKLLPDAMEEEGLESLRITGVGTVYLTDDINVSLKDKEGAYKWLEDHGFGDIIKPYVFPQTIKAFTKEQINEGNELPEDLFKISPFTRAAIRSS